MGETEKNFAKVFDQAQNNELVLPNGSRIEPTITTPSTKTRGHEIWVFNSAREP